MAELGLGSGSRGSWDGRGCGECGGSFELYYRSDASKGGDVVAEEVGEMGVVETKEMGGVGVP